jgi:hypothetical protein
MQDTAFDPQHPVADVRFAEIQNQQIKRERQLLGKKRAPQFLRSSNHDFFPVGVATELPGASASEGSACGKGVFHELEVMATTISYFCEDGKWARYQLAENPRAVRESAKHGGVLIVAERRFDLKVDSLPTAPHVDHGLDNPLGTTAASRPRHDAMEIGVVVI